MDFIFCGWVDLSEVGFTYGADMVVLREGLKFARKIGQAAPIGGVLGPETAPGSSVNSDAEWEAWLVNQVRTEYHPAATCAMLPQSQGGVVNAKLQVYGLGTYVFF